MKTPYWAILGLLAVTACHITAPPDPKAGLGPRATVYAPVLEEETGELFVVGDGLWAYKTSDPEQIRSYEVGQVVAFGDLDDEGRHLFAVVSTDGWGVRLQRLDTEPVEGRGAGSLVPLASFDLQTGMRWGFCTGAGAPSASPCLREAPVGTRWWLYELHDGGLVVPERPRAARRARATLPVELVATATIGAEETDVIAVDPPRRWLAVPGPPGPRPTRPRIVTAPDCQHGSPHRDALDAEWFSAEFAPPSHPVDVSATAYQLGADALVWCEGEAVKVATSSLFRPRIEVPGRGFSAPPMTGAEFIELRGEQRRLADWAARMAAAIATGDWTTADFAAEHLARTSEKSRRVDRALVAAMMGVAAGGRPEFAARLGAYATRLEWNPENSPAWLLGMAIVEDRLGNSSAALARTSELTELLRYVGDQTVRGWMIYFWTLDRTAARTKAGETFDDLEPHPKFALVARAEMASRVTPEKLDDLKSAFVDADIATLHAALAGEVGELECRGSCSADSYGKLWARGQVPPSALARVGQIALRPGYSIEHVPAANDALERLRQLVAVYPLLADEERETALRQATEAAVSWVGEQCEPVPVGTGEPRDELAPLRSSGSEGKLRVDMNDPTDATMAWLATRGVPTACDSTETLAAVSADFTSETSVTEVATRLLAVHVDNVADDELPATLATAAKFAAEFERGSYCARWNTALAAAYAEAGRHEEAKEYTEALSHCDVSDRADIDLVSAYLNFQRTGSISPDFERHVRQRMRRIVASEVPEDTECVGFLGLRYRLTDHLGEPLAALVDRLGFERPQEPEQLSIVSASDRLLIAQEHLADTLDHLNAGAPVDAAKSLGFARDTLGALEHQGGLAQVRWLDETLFDGKSVEVANGTTVFERVAPRELRKKSLDEVAAAEETGHRFRLARALLQGNHERAVELGTVELADGDLLCTVPRREDYGTVLDRKDGELRPVD